MTEYTHCEHYFKLEEMLTDMQDIIRKQQQKIDDLEQKLPCYENVHSPRSKYPYAGDSIAGIAGISNSQKDSRTGEKREEDRDV